MTAPQITLGDLDTLFLSASASAFRVYILSLRIGMDREAGYVLWLMMRWFAAAALMDWVKRVQAGMFEK